MQSTIFTLKLENINNNHGNVTTFEVSEQSEIELRCK